MAGSPWQELADSWQKKSPKYNEYQRIIESWQNPGAKEFRNIEKKTVFRHTYYFLLPCIKVCYRKSARIG
jgi:hypothetical protein